MNLLKKVFDKKFIGILLIIVILFNVISPSIITPKSYAIDVAGILLWPLTFLISGLADAALAIVSTIDSSGNNIFVDSIVYNKLNIFKVNIFDTTQMGESGVVMNTMLATIQKWYFITRVMAIAGSFVILIYVAIKIFISTAAGDKAKYKTLLKDWAVSLLLIFTMHFIMAAILYVADGLTNTMRNLAGVSSTVEATSVYDFISGKAKAAEWDSIIYGVMQWVLLVITFAFVIIYAKRVIMIAFLTVFAPLVALSYSVDKIKDGQSQILDKWMKEYIYTALMMPLDALLYTVLADAIEKNLDGSGNLIFGVALIIGYLPLRGWFNEFLGTDKAKHGMSGVAAGALLGNAISNISKGKSKSSSNSNNNTSNEDNSGNESLGEGSKNHDIETKASPNPLLNGGADKEKVSAPTSVAASNSAASLTAGQQAVQERQERRERARNGANRVGSALSAAGKLYGNGLGRVAAVTAGAMTMAATGKGVDAALVGMAVAKKANAGNEYGLAGKAVNGTVGAAKSVGKTAAKIYGAGSNMTGGVIDMAAGVAATASQIRDNYAVGGLINAMADNGTLDDIDDEQERLDALSWTLENTSDERFTELADMQDRGEITEDEAYDIMFREAIKNNKSEVKQAYADRQLENRTNSNAAIEQSAAKRGKEARIDAKKNGVTNNEAELKAIESSTAKSAKSRMKSDARAARKQENNVMKEKAKAIKNRGKK